MQDSPSHHRLVSLTGSTSFDIVFRRSRKIRSTLLHLHIQFATTSRAITERFTTSAESENVQQGFNPIRIDTTRIGIVVRKKIVRRAVDRVRIKRWLREALRRCAAEHPQVLASVGAIIVVWQNPYSVYSHDVSLESVYSSIVRGLQRAQAERTR